MHGRLCAVTITPRTLWLGAGILALAVCMWIVITEGTAVLLLLFTAIIIAEAMRPIVRMLHTRWHLPPSAGILLLYLLVLLIACTLVWLLA